MLSAPGYKGGALPGAMPGSFAASAGAPLIATPLVNSANIAMARTTAIFFTLHLSLQPARNETRLNIAQTFSENVKQPLNATYL